MHFLRVLQEVESVNGTWGVAVFQATAANPKENSTQTHLRATVDKVRQVSHRN